MTQRKKTTTDRYDLFSAFRGLPPLERDLVEMLAVFSDPITNHLAYRVLKAFGTVEDDSSLGVAQRQIAAVVRSLAKRNFLEKTGVEFECNPSIAELIARHSSNVGRFEGWVKAIGETGYRKYPEKSEYTYYYDVRVARSHARWAVHLDDAPTYFRAINSDIWRQSTSGFSTMSFLVSIFDDPFDPEWIYSVDANIRNSVLGPLLATRTAGLAAADDILEAWNSVVSASSIEGLDWSEMANHSLLCGNLPATAVALKHMNMADGQAYLGRMLCMQGEFDRSLEAFQQSIRLRRQSFGTRTTFHHWKCELYYLVSCIGSGTPKSIKEVIEYVDRTIKSRPWREYIYIPIKCAGLLLSGRIKESNELIKSAAEPIDWLLGDTQEVLVASLARRWIDLKPNSYDSTSLESLLLKSSQSKYRWLSAEFDSLLTQFGGNSHSGEHVSGHRELGCSPMIEAVDVQFQWERSLVALEQLGMGSTRPKKPTKESRLTWRVAYEDNDTFVTPVLQTRLKSGRWSKGRKIALKHLASDDKPDYLTLADVRACTAIKARTSSTFFIDHNEAVMKLVGHPLVFQDANPNEQMEVTREEPELQVSSSRGRLKIRLVPELPADGDFVISQPNSGKIVVTIFEDSHREIVNALGGDSLTVPANSKVRVNKAVAAVSGLLSVQSDIGMDGADVVEKPANSSLRIHLTTHGKGLKAEALVVPVSEGGPSYFPGRGSRVVFSVVDQKRVKVKRNLRLEARKLRGVVDRCPVLRDAERDGDAWLAPDPLDCLELLDQLRQVGDDVIVAWPKGKPMSILGFAEIDRLALKIRKAKDWFGIDGTVELDEGLVLSLRELIDRSKSATGRFLQIGEREFVALSEALQRRIDDLAGYAEPHGKKGLRFRPIRAHAIEGIAEEAGELNADESWSRQLRRFRDAERLTPELPTTLQAQLRDYQVDGFRWASRLAAWGAGACLADDMGLGKTIQALSVALARAPHGPTLVVAPTSVCANWIDEARRFTPALSALEFRSKNRDLLLKDIGPFDLLVCSYTLMHLEADRLSEQQWETVILDEAQAIKNKETMRSKAAMRLSGTFRMITTGTPIENHLGEIWNLFNFINPGLLGSYDSFTTKFALPIHRDKETEVRLRLKGLLQPFILRRTKAAVLDELPPRTEITQRIEMGKEERALYEAVRLSAIASLESGGGDAGPKHLRIFAELMKLRQACCHPRLVMSGTSIPGSKLEAFMGIVRDLKDGGHKALVFSQFVSHLAIVRESLDEAGITYRYLDGSTSPRARKQEVAKFQAGASDLFLISLRAGGHGLNLTAADYVIHLDPWWNPAVEDQASDRAHRIGQTRPVTVYRLVMRDSIEEKIVDLHTTKRDLADSLLEGADMIGKLSADEILGLIRTA